MRRKPVELKLNLMELPGNLPEKKPRAKFYFIIGYALLLAMALSWSIDNSIVAILFGGAVYFLFLGFYTNALKNAFRASEKSKNFRTHTSRSSAFSEQIKNIFWKKYTEQPIAGTTSFQGNTRSRRLVALIILAIFGSVFLFVIGSIISSSGDGIDQVDYFEVAEQQYTEGQYDSAYVNYRRTWRADEFKVEAMVGYGNVLAFRKQYDSAVVMYDKALTTDSEYLPAAYAKGSVYYNLERYNDCIAVMNPLLNANPNYYDGMLLIGDAYYMLRQYDDAISWYANAYENGGSRSSALCHIMAYIYDSKADYPKAINLYKEALEYDSTLVNIYKRLGELLPNEDGNYYRTQAARLEQRQ